MSIAWFKRNKLLIIFTGILLLCLVASCNFDRPDGAFNSKTPCEVLKERMGTQPVSTVV